MPRSFRGIKHIGLLFYAYFLPGIRFCEYSLVVLHVLIVHRLTAAHLHLSGLHGIYVHFSPVHLFTASGFYIYKLRTVVSIKVFYQHIINKFFAI